MWTLWLCDYAESFKAYFLAFLSFSLLPFVHVLLAVCVDDELSLPRLSGPCVARCCLTETPDCFPVIIKTLSSNSSRTKTNIQRLRDVLCCWHYKNIFCLCAQIVQCLTCHTQISTHLHKHTKTTTHSQWDTVVAVSLGHWAICCSLNIKGELEVWALSHTHTPLCVWANKNWFCFRIIGSGHSSFSISGLTQWALTNLIVPYRHFIKHLYEWCVCVTESLYEQMRWFGMNVPSLTLWQYMASV